MSCYICNDATTVAVARAIKKFHMQGDVFDENMSVTEIANELRRVNTEIYNWRYSSHEPEAVQPIHPMETIRTFTDAQLIGACKEYGYQIDELSEPDEVLILVENLKNHIISRNLIGGLWEEHEGRFGPIYYAASGDEGLPVKVEIPYGLSDENSPIFYYLYDTSLEDDEYLIKNGDEYEVSIDYTEFTGSFSEIEKELSEMRDMLDLGEDIRRVASNMLECMKHEDKIIENIREWVALKEKFFQVLHRNRSYDHPLTVGTTPNSLIICGAEQDRELTITKKVIDKCLRPEVRDEQGRLSGKTGHGLSEKQLVKVLDNVKNPAMILKGNQPDTLVAVTDIVDQKGRYLVVAVRLNAQENFNEINSILTIFGRDNITKYLAANIKNDCLLAVNTKKQI